MIRTLVLLALILAGCHREPEIPVGPGPDSPLLPAESPRDLLVGAIQEVEDLATLSLPGRVTLGKKGNVSAIEADTLFVYGRLTSDGLGACVSERHAYPRGILLITLRTAYGRPHGRIVSEVKRYTSHASFGRDETAQTSVTELYALSHDTIVTYLHRNGAVETYTFRLPVVTVTVGATTSETREVTRFARAGEIVVETRDGNGILLQTRRSSALADGSLVTRTEYPDGSWRSTRTLGRADGSILRENRTSPQ